TVAAFRIDTLPVSKKQFLAFVTTNPKWQRSNVSPIFADKTYLQDWKSDKNPGSAIESPVTNISWFAARAYAAHVGKRLPTVDEWEFIARADATKANATAEDSYTQTILEWYAAPNKSPLPQANTFPKNFYGVQALHGLIWEWNEDFNNSMVTGESRGDTGIERNLFCAGGAVSSTDVRNYAAFMRYAFRSSLKGNFSTLNLGFRCATSPTTPSTTNDSKP
ncbi:MAG: formylglycine-generating enzyme family protein, partial [Rubritalea sp.]|uniref:formylglycine-generating enzyme family protein n=1 Tax=Rubritalea sp. TaxID=2109375 RepID=UPI003242211E